jgi:ribosomal protein S12 methylthiotransferase
MAKKAFSIISLGCFRNTYDSEVIIQTFRDKGYVFSDHCIEEREAIRPKRCNTLIINTCGFIDAAKEESIETIRRAIELKKRKKIKRIVVYGCLAQRYRGKIEKFFPEVDEWFGIVDVRQRPKGGRELSPSYIGFLKICEGCLNRCSFCAIPLIKGPLRSRPAEELVAEARHLEAEGVRELNIIGQDITSWGRDLKTGLDLTSLLKRLLKATRRIGWIRLIYTHPRHITDSLLQLIAGEPRICKYIDLPIQHINDRILKAMNRRVTKKEVKSLISKIRRIIPEAAIRTSVIAGFPGETQGESEELLEFLKEVRFERLGVFTYSREEGTPAYYYMPQVHPATKKSRYRRIMQLQQKISLDLQQRFIGKELEVLIEEKQGDVYVGRSEYDAPEVDGVVHVKRKGLKIGDFYKAKIIDAYDYDLIGQ